ncbi:MAG TPA: DUF1553 domain-containing protein, partial [Caulifigura sp.]|nr:DUF1553 domain-containing protein [Caulifigura sp.]
VDGLWTSIASDSKYIPSEGGDLFRRSLYSFCKRTVGNPAMTLFDATTREACQVRRGRTNTPLQALAVLNETTYVEAARGLAQQALHQSGTSNERLLWMFRRATCRRPTPQELELLSRALTSHLAHFEQSATDAASLVKVGTSPELPGVDQVQLAAWTAVASVVLNLDEVVNRE